MPSNTQPMRFLEILNVLYVFDRAMHRLDHYTFRDKPYCKEVASSYITKIKENLLGRIVVLLAPKSCSLALIIIWYNASQPSLTYFNE